MTFNKVRLVDCCTIKPPKSEAKKLIASDDLVSFVPMKNLGIDTPDLLLNADKKLSDVSGSYTYFKDNDVLLAKITPCFENGKLGIAKGLTNGIGFGSSEFIVFRSKGRVVPKYLYYFFLQQSFRNIGKTLMTGAVGHKRVAKDFIENLEIYLPSIDIQESIVNKLNEVFSDIKIAINNAEINLNNARELFDSYLEEKLTNNSWPQKALLDVASESCSLCYGVVQPGDDYLNGVPVVRPTDLKSKYVNYDKLKKIDPTIADSYKRSILSGHELLLCVRGDTGLVSISNDELKGANVTRGIVPISFDKEVLDLQFGYLLFTSRFIQKQIKEKTYGAALMQINIRDLKKITVVIPPLNEQKSLEQQVNILKAKVDKLEEIYTSKLNCLDELEQSILQKAFNGELA
jgi:type I restriction enzyme S subunit